MKLKYEYYKTILFNNKTIVFFFTRTLNNLNFKRAVYTQVLFILYVKLSLQNIEDYIIKYLA